MPQEIEGKTSAEMRERYLHEHFGPLARRYFEKDERVRSVILGIAQYWCDEADDAVHSIFVPCPDETPKPWPQCLSGNPYYSLEWGQTGVSWLDDWKEHQAMRDDLPFLDENESMIVAFASCVHETGSQEFDDAENYRPYAIARRSPAGAVDIEVVGKVLRPEWEDRFDAIPSFDDDEATLQAKELLLEKIRGGDETTLQARKDMIEDIRARAEASFERKPGFLSRLLDRFLR